MAVLERLDDEQLDEELIVERARKGDPRAQEILIKRYKNFVRSKARSYFLIGADREDIVQEGMIGLFKAMRDYQPDKVTSFRSFAELCIKRQIITAIKTATRQKHIPLNSYVSLNKPMFDDESDRTLFDVMSTSSKELNPEHLIIKREELSKKVWEDHGVFVGRSLDTYISKLRKKLSEDETLKLTNVHGIGYVLVVK